jgi:hypothetical protein
MDLPGEVLRLRLDLLAVEVTQCLRSAGVPHVVLKGPSTSLWLYDPPRGYQDVDVLVPRSALSRAQEALAVSGVAAPGAGVVGEEAPHSLLLRSTEGYEVDVHVSLPTVPPSGDDIWNALAHHVEDLDLGVGRVPTLDTAGRCLVLALHALNNGPDSGQPIEDLARAQAACPGSVWDEAGALARWIGAEDLFRAPAPARRERGFTRRTRRVRPSGWNDSPPRAGGTCPDWCGERWFRLAASSFTPTRTCHTRLGRWPAPARADWCDSSGSCQPPSGPGAPRGTDPADAQARMVTNAKLV